MYRILGKRLSGKEIKKDIESMAFAIFEFGALKPVSEYIALYEVNEKGIMNQLDIYIKGDII